MSKSSGGYEHLNEPAERLRLVLSPWDEKPTQDQQRKTEQELDAMHGWIWRELPMDGMKPPRLIHPLGGCEKKSFRLKLLWKPILMTAEKFQKLVPADHRLKGVDEC